MIIAFDFLRLIRTDIGDRHHLVIFPPSDPRSEKGLEVLTTAMPGWKQLVQSAGGWNAWVASLRQNSGRLGFPIPVDLMVCDTRDVGFLDLWVKAKNVELFKEEFKARCEFMDRFIWDVWDERSETLFANMRMPYDLVEDTPEPYADIGSARKYVWKTCAVLAALPAEVVDNITRSERDAARWTFACRRIEQSTDFWRLGERPNTDAVRQAPYTQFPQDVLDLWMRVNPPEASMLSAEKVTFGLNLLNMMAPFHEMLWVDADVLPSQSIDDLRHDCHARMFKDMHLRAHGTVPDFSNLAQIHVSQDAEKAKRPSP